MEDRRMKCCTDPTGIWKEVNRGKEYNDAIDLYETVKKNEAFYIGDQWRNLASKTPDLLLVQINFLQRVCSMFVAKVASEDFGANFTSFLDSEEEAAKMRMIADQVEQVIENTDLKRQDKVHVRDAVVDGDTCCYFWWDPDAPTGQEASGAIRTENVENMNVLFGNPHDARVERQPYVILLLRKPVREVKEEALGNGIPMDQVIRIKPDADYNLEEAGSQDKLCTVAVKLWKEKDGSVWCVKSTQQCLVRDVWDTGLTRYPIAWMSWDKIRNSYHGRSAMTGLIPNQIALNTTYSSVLTQIRNTGFNKVIYSDAIGKWNPSPSAAIKVNGAIDVSKVATVLQGAGVNPTITNVMDSLMTMTRENMGASEASMGNLNPKNVTATAIIALQNADNVPMELHRQEYYAFVEQQLRVIIDMMRAYYGTRTVMITMPDPRTGSATRVQTEFDFSTLTDENYKVRVDVGTASYYSETLQVETLNNLFTSGILDKPEQASLFLDVMPDKYVPHKQKMLDFAKKKKAEQEAQQEQMAAVQNNGQMPGMGM